MDRQLASLTRPEEKGCSTINHPECTGSVSRESSGQLKRFDAVEDGVGTEDMKPNNNHLAVY